MSRLQDKYRSDVKSTLLKEFNYKSSMQVPGMIKITLNIGVGEAIGNAKLIDSALAEMTRVSGQKPMVTYARQSIANFKLREGMAIGVMTTLRRYKMWDFMDRFISIALPQVRDFRGLSRRSFDGHGNYTVGVREQIIFPEINFDDIDQIRGMNVTFHTSAKTDEEGLRMMQLIGMPFREN